jgi:hypothetical protein
VTYPLQLEVKSVTEAVPATHVATLCAHAPSTQRRQLSVTPHVLPSTTTPEQRSLPGKAPEVGVVQVSSLPTLNPHTNMEMEL